MTQSTYKSDLSTDERVMMGVVRAAELFKKESDTIFRNYGLTFSQYNALRVLDASENGMSTITNVSRIMLVSGANMTGIAKRLEKNGFLIRRRDPQDERITLLEISPKGSQTLKNIAEEKETNLKRYLENYSEDQKIQLLSSLKGILKKRKS